MRWLITGCSSGLGLSLTRAVLAQRDQEVIATSRNPASTPDLVKEISSRANGAWAALDVASPNLESQLESIIAEHGPIDVLINNAGFAAGGIFESMSIETVRQLYETNFFGAVRLMQSMLPRMRESGKGGVIVNVSSSEFWYPHAGASAYASTKWALEGISEAVASEVSAFNIRILLAQPGGMRTSFLEPAKVHDLMTPIPDAYKGTMADFVLRAIVSTHGSQNLDPDLSAKMIVEEVLQPTMVNSEDASAGRPLLRLQLGKECVDSLQAKVEGMRRESNIVKDRAVTCDFAA